MCSMSPYGSNKGRSCSSVMSLGTCTDKDVASKPLAASPRYYGANATSVYATWTSHTYLASRRIPTRILKRVH